MMKLVRILIDGKEIAGSVSVADTFVARLKGLAGKQRLEENEGLLLRPCSQIHTIGMRFSIDAVFLSKPGEILHLESAIPPGSVSRVVFGAHQVLELPAGSIDENNIKKGNIIALDVICEKGKGKGNGNG